MSLYFVGNLNILADKKLSPIDKLVYFCLVSFMNVKDGKCYPRYATIKERTGISIASIQRSIKHLAKQNLITVKRLASTNLYFLGNQKLLQETIKKRVITQFEGRDTSQRGILIKPSYITNNTRYRKRSTFPPPATDKQLLSYINNFEKNSKLNGYILDLRNNPGGLLTQAINITDFFLDDGEIVSTKGRKINETRRFFSRKGDEISGKPLIVIINQGSASASEIVSGALKDHKRAIILGEHTYGKGSVQSIIPLKNGGGIRLTISKYYLPSGKSISDVGVKPDIFVEEKGDDFRINSDTDNQLDYAIKLLKS